ncbi:MAG: VCBS repeat-containing protein [Deltaproteobacteria bacterium]|nr:VCBS repeat-containing protein [Deltaproteobacteria bacterium]
MRRLLAVGVMLGLAAGCSRSFEAPVDQPLTVSPQFAQVAPRETHTIDIDGGVPPMVYSFQGAPGSGEGATIDGGFYQAGRQGNTQDVVAVTDASGRTQLATFAITSPLAFAQLPVGDVPPGNTFDFAGTGGKRPYTFSLYGCFADGGVDPDGGSGASFVSSSAGLHYVAGQTGNTTDCVALGDATQDPLARVIAKIGVGAGLLVSPPNPQVAPRGHIDFQTQGGAPPFDFEFASPPGSGSDAELDGGSYRAGSTGPAQDVIQVVDSTGARTLVYVSVGSRLTVSPADTSVAPAGKVQFLAAGGQPAYAFSLVQCDNQVSTNPGASIDPASGLYVAGTHNNFPDDCVQVVDATNADGGGATASARVHVGAPLRIYGAAPGQVFPPQTHLQFVAVGGQPPYQFTVDAGAGGGSGNAFIDEHTGAYTAGDEGPGQDIVTVTDLNGQTDTYMVNIGAALDLQVAQGELHPGVPLQLLATGGSPPYHFSFSDRGNHSDGTVDATAGAYTPGLNFKAVDTLQVTDATGAVATRTLSEVGPLQVPYGSVDRVLAADLNGDGKQDVVLVELQSWGGGLGRSIVSIISQPGAAPRTDLAFWSFDVIDDALIDAFAADVDGDSHDDLIWVSRHAVGVMQAAADGTLGSPVPVFQRTRTANDDADGSDGFAINTDVTGLAAFVYEPASGRCGAKPGIVEIDFTGGTQTTNTCRQVVDGSITYLAAGDFNGDGFTDLAWVEMTDASGNPTMQTLHVQYAPAGTPPVTVQLPSKSADAAPTAYSSAQVMPVLHGPPGGDGDDVVIMLDPGTASVTPMITLLHGPGPSLGPTQSVQMNGHAVEDLNVLSIFGSKFLGTQDRELVAPVDGYDGLLPIYGVDAGLVSLGTPLQFASQIDGVASPDFNGDFVPDLAFTAGGIAATTIMYGEGDGTFGRFARFSASGLSGFADVDGDGQPDAFLIDNRSLQVLYADQAQYAYGPFTQLPAPPSGATIADLDGTGLLDLATIGNAGKIEIQLGGDGGSFGAPQELVQPDGGSFPLVGGINAGEFGGAAPGADLWTQYSDATGTGVVVYVRDQPFMAHTVTAFDSTWQICRFTHVDLNQDGLDDLVGICLHLAPVGGSYDLLTGAVISYAHGGGSQLTFDPFVDAGVYDQTTSAPAGGPHILGRWGEVVAAVSYGPTRLLWFITPNGSTNVVTNYRPAGAVFGPLGPEGAPLLVVQDTFSDNMHFYDQVADGGFVERPSTQRMSGAPVGYAPVDGGLPNLLLYSGTDLVIHPNDGGQFY